MGTYIYSLLVVRGFAVPRYDFYFWNNFIETDVVMKESTIQKQIFEYSTIIAEKYNLLLFAIPNESIVTALRMFGIEKNRSVAIVNHFKKMGLVPGVPDMCLLWNGNCIFFEIKRPGEKPTSRQERIHEKIERAGHKVFVVNSLEEFHNILRDFGVI